MKLRISIRDMVLVALFAALTAAGAFVKIPVPPVAFTLQTFFCVLAGLLLGAKKGALSQAVYIILGLCGLPIFTGGGGIGYVLNPTFGYLLGFMIAAFVTGFLSEKFVDLGKSKLHSFSIIFGIAIIGMLICYITGVIHLYLISKLVIKSNPSIVKVIMTGFVMFLPWDVVKMLAAAFISIRLIPVLKRK